MNSARTARWLLLILVLIFCLFATITHAQDDLAAGLKAFELEDNERARDLLQPLAEAGVAEAQYHLALLYYSHRLPHDRVKHRYWLTRAAEQEYLPAMETLGDDYWACENLAEQDLNKAVEWLEKAAGKGSGEAMFCLGFIREYDFEGFFGDPDYIMIQQWYQKAAEVGDPKHQEKYALTMLDRRFGTPDRTAAAKWLAIAAEGGQDVAADYLALMRRCRGQPENQMDVLNWRADYCTELPLKSLRVAVPTSHSSVTVFTGKGKEVLRLGPESQREQAEALYYKPDISPDQRRMVSICCQITSKDSRPGSGPVYAATDPAEQKLKWKYLLVEADLNAGSRQVIYQSERSELVDSPVYTHDGKGVAFLSRRDLVILDRDTGEIVRRVKDVLVDGSILDKPYYPTGWPGNRQLLRSPKPGTFYLVTHVDGRQCIGTVNVNDASVLWQRRIEAPEALGYEVFGNPELFGDDPHIPGLGHFDDSHSLLWSPCRRYQFFGYEKGHVVVRECIGCYDHQRGKRFKVKTVNRYVVVP